LILKAMQGSVRNVIATTEKETWEDLKQCLEFPNTMRQSVLEKSQEIP
jgi:hypothetical protein